MGMDWQQPVALAIVVGTAVAFAWRPVRRHFGPRRFSLTKDTPCGCVGKGGPPPPRVLVTGRKGERPRVEMRS